jgi:5S rRNA maturation endonuclease (ribonuclease M5)
MSAEQLSRVTITKPKVILVEGKEDKKFFDAFIQDLHLRSIQVVPMDGRHPLTDKIESVKNTPGFGNVTTFGVVIDADRNYQAAQQSLSAALRNLGFAVPADTLTKAGNTPSVIVMILPKRNVQGALEDLCLSAVKSDPAFPCLNRYFDCLSKKGINPLNSSKAKIHAFISSRSKADLTFGQAAQAGYWPFSSNVFDEVKQFLRTI